MTDRKKELVPDKWNSYASNYTVHKLHKGCILPFTIVTEASGLPHTKAAAVNRNIRIN